MCLCPRFLLLSAVIAFGSSVAADAAVKEAEVNGVTISYVEDGSGEPVVFLHPAVSDSRAWDPYQPMMSADYHFIAPTMRYHGSGEWPDKGEDYSIVAHADDMAAFINGLGLGPVHLVGWSMGGEVATALALKHPELVQSLIMYEGAPWTMIDADADAEALNAINSRLAGIPAAVEEGDGEKATRLLIEGVFQIEPGSFDRLPSGFQDIVLTNARTMLLFWTGPAFEPTCGMLEQFDKPVLLIHGEDSVDIFRIANETTAACLPQAEIAVLPNVNHDGPMRNPEGFTAMIKQFVKKN